MNFIGSVVALESQLPPMRDMVEYVVHAGGLLIRAEDARLEALVAVANSRQPLTGLALVQPLARLQGPRVPEAWLLSILASARRAMPAEAMYQLVAGLSGPEAHGGWGCARPRQVANATSVTFQDTCDAAVDLHSHNSMAAFFSSTDDADEQGFRFYAVIGKLDTPRPQIAVRVGVYGHVMRVPALTVFAGLGPFVDTLGRCRECGCTEAQACPGGCYWVEEDLCSQCAGVEEIADATA